MSALSVQQADIDRSDAIAVEIKNVLKEGAKVGAVEKIPAIFLGAPPTDGEILPLMSLLSSVAVAIVRLWSTGTTKFPMRLPTYTVASAPSAADHEGSVIYVSNGAAGGPVVAFSDSGDWLRCDTRGVISA